MIFSAYRGCCCSIGGGGDECLFCWSLRDTCPPPCPSGGGPSGGNGAEDCDPETDSTCEAVHENDGNDECKGCTYPYNGSECYQFDLCPCIWVCDAGPGATCGEGGFPVPNIPCPKIEDCPKIIGERLQCPESPCPNVNYPQSCTECDGLSGTWRLVQDPYASVNNTLPSCQCCCEGYTGQIVSC